MCSLMSSTVTFSDLGSLFGPGKDKTTLINETSRTKEHNIFFFMVDACAFAIKKCQMKQSCGGLQICTLSSVSSVLIIPGFIIIPWLLKP